MPISKFYQEVCMESTKMNEDGFMLFSQELCDKFGEIDPVWKQEMGWESAFGQYIYVEYCWNDEEKESGKFEPLSKEKLDGMECVVRLAIISCEDSVSMEVIMTEEIGKYCLNAKKNKDVWNTAVRSMAILLKLYVLNKKGKDAFWHDVLEINRQLGVINETPMVRILAADKKQDMKQVCSMTYNPTVPLPRKDDCLDINSNGYIKRLKVNKVIFNYDTPFGKLGEICIETELVSVH